MTGGTPPQESQMKMLFTTTAIVLALGLPATLLAQTADNPTTRESKKPRVRGIRVMQEK